MNVGRVLDLSVVDGVWLHPWDHLRYLRSCRMMTKISSCKVFNFHNPI